MKYIFFLALNLTLTYSMVDNAYAKNKVSNRLEDSLKDLCSNVTIDKFEKSPDKIQNAFDPRFIGGGNRNYTICESRYVPQNFLTEEVQLANSVNMLSEYKQLNICADAVKNKDDCKEEMVRYQACMGIGTKEFLKEGLNYCQTAKKTYDKYSEYKKCIENTKKVKEGEDKIDCDSLKPEEFVDVAISDRISLEDIDKNNYWASTCQNECKGEPKAFVNNCFQKLKPEEIADTVGQCFAYKEVAQININDDSNSGSDKYQSFDGVYTCKKSTAFTADFKACKNLLVAYNAAMAADQGMMIAENTQRGFGEAKAWETVNDETAKGNGQVAGLKGVKEMAKTNKTIEIEKASFFTAKAGVFTGLLAAWPTKKNLKKACDNASTGQSELCNDAAIFAGDKTEQMFIHNKNVQRAFNQELVKAIGDAAAAGIKAAMYDKQAKMVEDVEKLQVVKDDDDTGFVVGPTYCEQYPNAPRCGESGNRVGVGGYQGGGLNVSGGGNTDYTLSNSEVGEFNEGGENAPSLADKAAITSMLGGSGDKGSSGFSAPGGAKITESGPNAGGGAGGGGGSASLASDSGSGNRGAAPQGDGFGVTKSGAKYAAVSGSGAKYSGTSKRFGNDKKVDNPFSNLFGAKNANRTVASDVDDIAPKESELFKKISNRYQEAQKQKRL